MKRLPAPRPLPASRVPRVPGGRFRYRVHARIRGRRAPLIETFVAANDATAIAYCKGSLAARLPAGAQVVRLERLGRAPARRGSTGAGARKKGATRRQKNPAPTARELAQAERAFERFTGHRAKVLEQHFLPRASGAAWALGPVPEIRYIATRNGETVEYVHKFRTKSRPLLAATSDGSMLYLLGGAYSVTDRGIVDDP